MSKAYVKKMVLPDAPKPTKPMRVDYPREKERALRLMEHHEINLNPKNKAKPGPQGAWFWDKARLSKLRRMYNEGYPVKEIARECGASSENACQLRINKEIASGVLKPRKRHFSDDEKQKMVEMRKAGMLLQDIAKDFKTSKDNVKQILYRYRKKQEVKDV